MLSPGNRKCRTVIDPSCIRSFSVSHRLEADPRLLPEKRKLCGSTRPDPLGGRLERVAVLLEFGKTDQLFAIKWPWPTGAMFTAVRLGRSTARGRKASCRRPGSSLPSRLVVA